ncbi:cysteine-rich motor neuron 1 protein-like [Physella acuta]|uniref:cysteine-rich motor neuron 1 protein-like n=1 Tax=Physella acuta TaxID=109671 RepID=UPI0027DD1BA0|nr:cysteine-rich motor neuron 1 protein-like [Physella acuta]
METLFKTLTVTALIIVCGKCVLASPRAVDPLAACSTKPLLCLMMYPGQFTDQCQTDANCAVGSRCCYNSCVRSCVTIDPCEKVLCKAGYSCQSRDTPCASPPCQKEAVCIPESRVLCPTLACPTQYCPAGYERVIDTSGCETCQCKPKKVCSSTCFTLCSYGFQLGADGCPTCKCNPAPVNPCTNMTCSKSQECRLINVACTKAPCMPVATCVRKLASLYDNSCSLKDATTTGLPVLLSDKKTELNCFQQSCPDGAVCVSMGTNINRCCWQQTQEKVLDGPRVGECPEEYMVDPAAPAPRCEIDAECPTDQKCCYINKSPGKTRFYGVCLTTIHKVLENAPEFCSRNVVLWSILSMFGFC